MTESAPTPKKPLSPSNRRGLVQVHVVAVLVGFVGLFSKWIELGSGVITFGRMVVGSAALLLFARWSGTSLRIHGRRNFWMLVISGAVLAVHWLTFFHSIQVSTVAVGLLAFSTFPLFVTFLEPLVFGERLKAFDILIAVLVVAGLATIAPIFDVSNNLTQGALWGTFSSLTCAVLSLLSRATVREHSAVTVVFYQQFFGAFFAFPAILTFDGQVSARSLWLLLLLGVMFTAFTHCLMVASLRHIRAQIASVVIGLEPVYGIAFAAMFLGEIPTSRTLLGGSIIFGAVFWASWKHSRPVSE